MSMLWKFVHQVKIKKMLSYIYNLFWVFLWHIFDSGRMHLT
jgi:hypothetical protein